MPDNLKLSSWLDLSGKRGIKRRGSRSKHVASIYFRNKDYTFETADEEILRKLANLFSYAAKKNNGLRGSVVGHADCRMSRNPDNVELSRRRGLWTARRFKKYTAASARIIVGRIEFDVEGNGDAACRADPEAKEGKPESLAKYRRADVWVRTAIAVEPPPKGHILPPDLSRHVWGDRWKPNVLKGSKSMANSIARQAFAYFGAEGAASKSGILFHSGFSRRIKPPWWDERYIYLHEAHGKSELVQKTLLLMRDMKELLHWEDRLFDLDFGGSYLKWIDRSRSGPKDVVIREAGYYLYIRDAVKELAREIYDETD